MKLGMANLPPGVIFEFEKPGANRVKKKYKE